MTDKPRGGYFTQCDAGGFASLYDAPVCPSTARLSKPARWRCDACEKKFGPLPKETPA